MPNEEKVEKKIEELTKEVQEEKEAIRDLYRILEKLLAEWQNTLSKEEYLLKKEELKNLLRRIIDRPEVIHSFLDFLEMAMDLQKDLSYILQEEFRYFPERVKKLEEEGYFRFLKGIKEIFSSFVKSMKEEDYKDLAQHMDQVVHSIKALTQPEVLEGYKKLLPLIRRINVVLYLGAVWFFLFLGVFIYILLK